MTRNVETDFTFHWFASIAILCNQC